MVGLVEAVSVRLRMVRLGLSRYAGAVEVEHGKARPVVMR